MQNLQAVAIVFAQHTDTLTIGTVSFKAVLQVEIGQNLDSKKPEEFIKNAEVVDYIEIHENGIPICDCRAHQLMFFASYSAKGIDLRSEFDNLANKWVEDNSVHSLSQSLFITLAQSIPHYPVKFRPEPTDAEALYNSMDLRPKAKNAPIQSQEADKMQMDLELKYNPDNTKVKDSIIVNEFDSLIESEGSEIPAKKKRTRFDEEGNLL